MIGNDTFRGNPVSLDISRSVYHLCPTITGTFKVGELVPFFTDMDVLPGSSRKVRFRSVIRGSTPIAVPMDNLYLDTFYFFVPNKMILSRQSMSPSVNDSNHSWEAIVGAQDSLLNMPLPSGDASVPLMQVADDTGVAVGGYWDWTGNWMPSSDTSSIRTVNVNPLGFLAYSKIWNDYFRDPNGSMNPVTYSVNGGYVLPSGGPSGFRNPGSPTILSNYNLLPACRFHGYFGSALPWPQRNSVTISIPVGTSAPIGLNDMGILPSSSLDASQTIRDLVVSKMASSQDYVLGSTSSSGLSRTTISNLFADLSQAAGVTVNEFRRLVQEQRWYEALARGGNNTLAELTHSTFSVTPSDAASNRPELLGSTRKPLNIIQVNNTAGNNKSTETQSSLGSTGSFCLTSVDEFMFSKSFDTWGVIVGLACVRCDDTFHQGIERQYSRFRRFDYYWPQFANLGEQSILEKELFVSGIENKDNSTFGFQEAYAEYRMAQNHVAGLIRPDKSLNYWTYTNHFEKAPSLNDFLDARGLQKNIDRTLQVESSASGFQFVGQFATEEIVAQPMPTYSIPGLVDHH